MVRDTEKGCIAQVLVRQVEDFTLNLVEAVEKFEQDRSRLLG